MKASKPENGVQIRNNASQESTHQKFMKRGQSLQQLHNKETVQKQLHQFQSQQYQYCGNNDKHLINKLKSLQSNPNIHLQTIQQPQFHTKLLGQTSVSIQKYIPSETLSSLKVNGNQTKVKSLKSLKTSPSMRRNQLSPNQDLGDVLSYNQKALMKYKEVTVKLMSDRNFICSQEYLRDNSYQEFQNQYISSMLSPKGQPIDRHSYSKSVVVPHIFTSNQEYNDILDQAKYKVIDSIPKGPPSAQGSEASYNAQDQPSMGPTYSNFAKTNFKSIPLKLNGATNYLPQISERFQQSSERLSEVEMKAVTKLKGMSQDFNQSKEISQKTSHEKENHLHQGYIASEQQFNFNHLGVSQSQKDLQSIQKFDPIHPTLQSNPYLDNMIASHQNDQDRISQTKKDIFNVKNYNRFRQKIANEDRKFHLLAHNLCDNLKRSHIRLDIDDYQYLKGKIKEAIVVKYNKQPQQQKLLF